MRGVPKTQGQTCWTNDGGSTEDQADGTSKTVLSRFFRILLAHSSLFRERETQKETIRIPPTLCSQLTLSVLEMGCETRKRNSGR